MRVLVEEAPAAVRDLQARGVVFDLDHEGRLALGLEGGHSARRIVHSGGSQTGREITSKLAAMVAEPTSGSRCASAPRRRRSGPTASAATA